MRYLPDLPLKASLHRHLAQAQRTIDDLPSYYARVKQAKVAWQTKKKKGASKVAFQRIEQALQAAGAYCHYCEGALGTSIEHFYPRGFYPDLTFVWDNYLWSCKACNTQYKGAQFQLFEDAQGASVQTLVKNRRFVPPPNRDSVCLHPRQDDALAYWQLELETGKLAVRPTLSVREQTRAHYTLSLLQLNQRSELLTSRKASAAAWQAWMCAYVALSEQPTAERIRRLLPGKPDSFYKTSLAAQQAAAQTAILRKLRALPHPSIGWQLSQQAEEREEWKRFFQRVPNVF